MHDANPNLTYLLMVMKSRDSNSTLRSASMRLDTARLQPHGLTIQPERAQGTKRIFRQACMDWLAPHSGL